MVTSPATRHLRRLWPLSALGVGLLLGVRESLPVPAPDRYVTAAVDQGEILDTVSANGTLSPVALVNVGTQVSGTVQKLHVDFNDRVRSGQVLAELDPSLFVASLEESRARLANAHASLKLAQANERRSRALYEKDYIARAELDQAREALAAARAQMALAHAQVARDQTHLRYSVIRSPVSGVVVSRDVDEGQTVAASFQTPTLFKIARDLHRMQIDVSVSEADIGRLRIGQMVHFSVDAFPEQGFRGEVKQIRLNASTQQHVVTYHTIVAADNAQGVLFPSMTAYVHIIVERRSQALRIPNAALRIGPAPAPAQNAASVIGPSDGGEVVYKLSRNGLAAVKVRTGITDHRFTEVLEGDLKPGDRVVVQDLGAGQAQNDHRRFRFF